MRLPLCAGSPPYPFIALFINPYIHISIFISLSLGYCFQDPRAYVLVKPGSIKPEGQFLNAIPGPQ